MINKLCSLAYTGYTSQKIALELGKSGPTSWKKRLWEGERGVKEEWPTTASTVCPSSQFQLCPSILFTFLSPSLNRVVAAGLSAHSSNQKRSSSPWGTLWRSRARWDIQSLQQVLGLRQHLSFKEGQPGGTQIRQSDHIHGLLWNRQGAAALLQSTSRCLSISSSNSDRLWPNKTFGLVLSVQTDNYISVFVHMKLRSKATFKRILQAKLLTSKCLCFSCLNVSLLMSLLSHKTEVLSV